MNGNGRESKLGRLYVCEAVYRRWEPDWRREVHILLDDFWILTFQPPTMQERIRTINEGGYDGLVVSKGILNDRNGYGRGSKGGVKNIWPGLVRDDIITRYIELDIAHALNIRIGGVHSWMVSGQEQIARRTYGNWTEEEKKIDGEQGNGMGRLGNSAGITTEGQGEGDGILD